MMPAVEGECEGMMTNHTSLDEMLPQAARNPSKKWQQNRKEIDGIRIILCINKWHLYSFFIAKNLKESKTVQFGSI